VPQAIYSECKEVSCLALPLWVKALISKLGAQNTRFCEHVGVWFRLVNTVEFMAL